MEGDNGVKYMLQKMNNMRGGSDGDKAMKYMSDKVKEIKGMEGEKVLQYLKEKLKEILVWLHHLGAALLHKLDEILPPRIKHATLKDWIIWVSVFLAVVLFVRMCCWSCCRSVFKTIKRCCCCCCGRRGSYRMMKAPGRNLTIARAPFESNPAGYFRGLRARVPLDPQFGSYQSLV